MAGGKYDKLAGKTRPGTYINFESDRNDTVGNSERGIVLLPLIGYDFGPAKTPITLTAAAPDAYSVELGRSVYDATNDKMRLIREAFKKASKVISRAWAFSTGLEGGSSLGSRALRCMRRHSGPSSRHVSRSSGKSRRGFCSTSLATKASSSSLVIWRRFICWMRCCVSCCFWTGSRVMDKGMARTPFIGFLLFIISWERVDICIFVFFSFPL